MKKKIGWIFLYIIIVIQFTQFGVFQNKFHLSDFQQKPAEIYRQIYAYDAEDKGWDG